MSHYSGQLNLADDCDLWIATPEGPRPIARAEDLDENAARLMQCWNACAGLTPEQVEAIPRLVAWFTGAGPGPHPGWLSEWRALGRIFPGAKP